MLRVVALALALAAPVAAMAQPQLLANSWDADGPSQFNHVLSGTPGRKVLRIDAASTAVSGQAVAVYVADAKGQRSGQPLLSVVATPRGASRTGAVTLPPAAGSAPARLPIVVIVEPANRASGEYTLTLSP